MTKTMFIGATTGALIGSISLLFDGAFKPFAASGAQLGAAIGFVIGRVASSALIGVVLFCIVAGLVWAFRKLLVRSRG